MTPFTPCNEPCCSAKKSCSLCEGFSGCTIGFDLTQASNDTPEPATTPKTALERQEDIYNEGFDRGKRASKRPEKHQNVEWMWTD